MKKIVYVLILPLIVVSGLVFANLGSKNEHFKTSRTKSLSAAEREAALNKWEASKDGVKYNKWKASPNGKKVFASAAKINEEVKNHTEMEAVVTSLSLPAGSALGFGMMVKIKGEDYILCFRQEDPSKDFLPYQKEFKLLYGLKVNDKIIIKSRSVMHAPKYSFPILWGDYVKLGSNVIFSRITNENGC